MTLKATGLSSPASNFGAARSRPSRWRDPGFWNAVAGMAFALLVAATVVALEFRAHSDSLASHFRRRADKLEARLAQTEARADRQSREIATLRQRLADYDRFNRILAAPDAALVHMRPSSVGPNGPMATLVISRKLATAAILVDGLPTASGRSFKLWWLPRSGAPILAASLTDADQGRLLVIPNVPEIAGAELTLDHPPKASAYILKGVVKR